MTSRYVLKRKAHTIEYYALLLWQYLMLPNFYNTSFINLCVAKNIKGVGFLYADYDKKSCKILSHFQTCEASPSPLKKLIIKSLTHTYVKSCNRQFKTRVSIVRVESIFINASKHLKKPDQYAKRCIIDTYWKSYKKSHSTLRAKRATFTFWKDKRSLKNAKYDPFWRLFQNL